jgi:hypothetical protein
LRDLCDHISPHFTIFSAKMEIMLEAPRRSLNNFVGQIMVGERVEPFPSLSKQALNGSKLEPDICIILKESVHSRASRVMLVQGSIGLYKQP